MALQAGSWASPENDVYQPSSRNTDFPDRRGDAVDLGFAAPIDAGTRRHALDERRRVSARWLSATKKATSSQK